MEANPYKKGDLIRFRRFDRPGIQHVCQIQFENDDPIRANEKIYQVTFCGKPYGVLQKDIIEIVQPDMYPSIEIQLCKFQPNGLVHLADLEFISEHCLNEIRNSLYYIAGFKNLKIASEMVRISLVFKVINGELSIDSDMSAIYDISTADPLNLKGYIHGQMGEFIDAFNIDYSPPV